MVTKIRLLCIRAFGVVDVAGMRTKAVKKDCDTYVLNGSQKRL